MDRAGLAELYKAGDVLAERYRVARVIGAGGMGVVVAARHVDLDSLVAIKMLRPEVLSNSDVVARFAAEARAAVRIKSEHVARVTDVGTLANGAPYMVMEYLEGSDLAALVEERGGLPVLDAVDYVLQACEAIAEAHSLGIVHRDLKPGNLFLSRRADGSELVKVLDFGISKTTDAGGASGSLTSTTALLGSPTYMSPEQLSSSKNVDLRTDIWALGVILHQILSAELPFRADTLPELFLTIIQSQPAPLRSLRADVPRGIEAVVLRCLEKDRTRRYENVGELAVALSAFAPVRSRVSVERILRLTPRSATSPSATQMATVQEEHLSGWPAPSATPAHLETNQTWGNTSGREAQRSRRRPLFAALLALLVGGGVGARMLLTQHDAQVTGVPSAAATALPARPTEAAQAPAPLEPAVLPSVPSAAQEPTAELPASTPPLAEPPAEPAPAAGARHASPRRPARPPPRRPTPAAPEAPEAPAAPAVTPPAAAPHPVATPSTPPKPKTVEWEDDRR